MHRVIQPEAVVDDINTARLSHKVMPSQVSKQAMKATNKLLSETGKP